MDGTIYFSMFVGVLLHKALIRTNGLVGYFPRMILLMPHVILIGIILSSYPYSSSPDTSDTPPVPTQAPTEGTTAWQANLQGIQNLMGFVADMVTTLRPYTYHLCLTPQHVSPSTPNISVSASQATRSSYTPHILTLLVVTFFPLLIMIHLPAFPIREVALFAGLFPFFITHPATAVIASSLLRYFKHKIPLLVDKYESLFVRINPSIPKWVKMPVHTSIERLIDNDRLPSEIWRAETREVELFENERYEGPVPSIGTTGQKWSKGNLRPGERRPWSRGRDGWTGIGPEDEIRSVHSPFSPFLSRSDNHFLFRSVYGKLLLMDSIYSSNLTFSLSPNWRFIHTEDWRRDLTGEWAECGGADQDGWVYSNDAWVGPKPRPYTAGGGSVTRRRRWIRRIWFDGGNK